MPDEIGGIKISDIDANLVKIPGYELVNFVEDKTKKEKVSNQFKFATKSLMKLSIGNFINSYDMKYCYMIAFMLFYALIERSISAGATCQLILKYLLAL